MISKKEKEARDILVNEIADILVGEYCKQCKICENEDTECYYGKAIDIIDDLIRKQQEELENNKKFKKDIVNLIMLWDEEKLPENNMIIETLKTIIHEFSRLEDIEDKKIQVEVKFVEEKRDKYWKDKIREKIKELKENSLIYWRNDIIKILSELLEENNND